MENKSTIRLVFIGAGRVADVHLDALAELNGRAELVGFCEIVPAALEARTEQWGVPGFADINALFANVDCDAALILLPHDCHEDAVRACTAHGKHILLEKPIASSIAEGRRIAEMTAVANVTLLVGHNGLFHPAFIAMQEAAEQGRIGKLISATAESSGWLHFRENDFRLSKKATGGGVWMDTGSHLIYSLRALLGEISESQGMTARLARKEMEGEDHALVNLRFASGALASIQASYGRKRPGWKVDWPDGYFLQITLWGDTGALRYTLCPEVRMEIFNNEAWEEFIPVTPFSDSFSAQLDHFCDCIDGSAQPRVSAEDALSVLNDLQSVFPQTTETL